VKRETFYRPLGGGVEFGESAADAVRRELVEETGVSARGVRHLATVENIFVHDGKPGHEVVFLFDVALAAELPPVPFTVLDSDDQVLWMPLSAFEGDDALPLYPHGLLELLR
jgi:ADP-ribose pyrophosphatase YjhB (NUDIX family)